MSYEKEEKNTGTALIEAPNKTPVYKKSVSEIEEEYAKCELLLKKITAENSLLINESLQKFPNAALAVIRFALNENIPVEWALKQAFSFKVGQVAFQTQFLIDMTKRRFGVEPRYEEKHDEKGNVKGCFVQFYDCYRIDGNGDPLPVKGACAYMSMSEGLASASDNSQSWKKHARKMLRYRVAKLVIDTTWPGVLHGYSSGEQAEFVEFEHAAEWSPSPGPRPIMIMGNAPKNSRMKGMVESISIEKSVPEKSDTRTNVSAETVTEEEMVTEGVIFSSFLREIACSDSVEELSEVASRINETKNSGDLIPDEISELQDCYKKRLHELKEA